MNPARKAMPRLWRNAQPTDRLCPPFRNTVARISRFMIKTLRLAVSAIALTAALAGGVASAQTRSFTAKEMASLDRLSDPRVSPDGRYVVYAVRTMDFDANKASMSIWIADLKARMAQRRLAVSEGGASSARWSADGKAIYFLSSRAGGTDQVFRTDVTGEAAVQVTQIR